MIFTSAMGVVNAIIHAYYDARDVEATLACVTDDIEWVGTENNDSAYGKKELRALLQADVQAYPNSFTVELGKPLVQKLGEDAVVITTTGEQAEYPGRIAGLAIRGTICCVKSEKGWLVANAHVSVPNAEVEKYLLQSALNLELEKQATLLANIPGGVAMCRVKKDGRFVMEYASDGLAKLRGYANAKELLQLMAEDARSTLEPKDRKRIEQAVQMSVKNETPFSVVFHAKRKAQEPVLLNLQATLVKNTPLDADDLAVFYVVEMTLSEEAIRAKMEQDYYRAILDLTQTTYFEVDKNHNFYFSDSFKNYKMSEYGITAILGSEDAKKCIHPDDIEMVKEYLHQVHLNGTSAPTFVRMLMKDGNYQWTELTAHAELAADHAIGRMTGIMRNVSIEWEKQRDSLEFALGEAKRANQAKSDFLSRVSHDMRTPLNVILSIAKMVPDERPSYDMMLSYFNSIDEEGSFLLRLINDVLDMQKMESGVIDIKPEPIDLDGVINPVIERAKHLADKKQVEFSVTIEKFLEGAKALIDPLRIQQLLNNLLANAIKYTPEHGKVELIFENLSVENDVATDKVIVRDNGLGMSAEFMEHMYDPFTQEHGGTTSVTRGTGLGLSIVKKIVDIMGGTISCKSELGKGTEFGIILKTPLIGKADGYRTGKIEYAAYDDFALIGRRILLCEDHPLNAMVAEKLLRRKGLIVTHAENGQVGVDDFTRSTEGYYDAVLMDIRMPVMDGLEATRVIRALPRSDAKKIPIIAMTANAYSDDVDNCIAAGMNAHLAKPVETQLLWDTLYKYLDFSKEIQKLKVIVVDDIELNRVVVAEAIVHDYEPLMAESAAQALALLPKYSDVVAVITDIMMPEMDGHELIKVIRSRHEYDNIAILANTQYGEKSKEEELLKDGADDFIYKPTTPAIIMARLKNILMRRNNMTRSK